MPIHKLHSLFFSAWYPNRDDAMSGLFVRKHADAVSRFCKVTVLYVHADERIRKREIKYENFNAVHEVVVYYPSGTGFLRKIIKPIQFVAAYIVGIRKVFSRYGRPDIVHVNVLTRTALPALYLKLTRRIPFVVTEHWTRYLPSRSSYKGFFRKIITKIAVANASSILPVSDDLRKAMQGHGLKNHNYQVVNNVVEDNFFDAEVSTNSKSDELQLIHISCFDDEQKNISGILRVTAQLMTERTDFRLILVGTGKDFQKMKELALRLHIPEHRLIFTGELPPVAISEQLKESDFMVLFSNHENAPVVISESLACGKPVIATRVGGIPEMIDDSNGILLNKGDEATLKQTLIQMLDHFQEYNTPQLQEAARTKYSYQSVGQTIFHLYKTILS